MERTKDGMDLTGSRDDADPGDYKSRLAAIAERAQARFTETYQAREHAFRLSREVVRTSANSIRATHRGEYDGARELRDRAGALAGEMARALAGHPSVYHAGFVEDAQKEYVEATATLAFVSGGGLAGPEELEVGPAPYMNGLAEAVGELRRSVLDSLGKDDVSRCQALLEMMDEVYGVLVSIDFPEAVTRGLRRSTDMVRGLLERTRGDLNVALRQRGLERKLDALRDALERTPGPNGDA